MDEKTVIMLIGGFFGLLSVALSSIASWFIARRTVRLQESKHAIDYLTYQIEQLQNAKSAFRGDIDFSFGEELNLDEMKKQHFAHRITLGDINHLLPFGIENILDKTVDAVDLALAGDNELETMQELQNFEYRLRVGIDNELRYMRNKIEALSNLREPEE